MMMKKDDTWCHGILNAVLWLLMGLAFVNALASGNFKVITKYGLVWAAAGAGIMVLLRFRKTVKNACCLFLDNTRAMVVLLILLTVLQMLVFPLISGNILSDAGEVYRGVFAEDKTAVTNYLSLWQNNMPLYVYENLIRDVLGLKELNRFTPVVYTVINIVNYDLGFLCLALMMKKLYGKRAGFLTVLICFFTLGLNNQMYQFYTTALSWPATCLGLYLYICIKASDSTRKRLILTGILGIAVSWGYLTRPSSIIYMIAVVLFELFHVEKSKKYFIKAGSFCLAMFAGALLLAGLYQLAAAPYRLETNSNKNAGMAQYMAYGITGSGAGTVEVREKIAAAETKEERSRISMRIWKDELKRLGILGYPDFLVKKHLAETGDGTYGLMSPHIEEVYSSDKLVSFFQNFWYSQGRFVDLTAFGMQLVYVLFLLAALAGIKVKTGFSFVLKLSLLGWHGFLLLFEGARTGYTIQAFPVMIPLAALGILYVLYGGGFGKEEKQLEEDGI